MYKIYTEGQIRFLQVISNNNTLELVQELCVCVCVSVCPASSDPAAVLAAPASSQCQIRLRQHTPAVM